MDNVDTAADSSERSFEGVAVDKILADLCKKKKTIKTTKLYVNMSVCVCVCMNHSDCESYANVRLTAWHLSHDTQKLDTAHCALYSGLLLAN